MTIKLGDVLVGENGVRWRATIENRHWLKPEEPQFTLFTIDYTLQQASIDADGTGFYTGHGEHKNGQKMTFVEHHVPAKIKRPEFGSCRGMLTEVCDENP